MDGLVKGRRAAGEKKARRRLVKKNTYLVES